MIFAVYKSSIFGEKGAGAGREYCDCILLKRTNSKLCIGSLRLGEFFVVGEMECPMGPEFPEAKQTDPRPQGA